MNKAQQKRFDSLYQQHVNALRRQGKAENTIDGYSRALRRITEFFDLCPDKLTQDHLHIYFDSLIKTHSWSTVKVDRNGLQFFFKYILKKTWVWVDIVAYRDIGKGRELGAEASSRPRKKYSPTFSRQKKSSASLMVPENYAIRPLFS